jgi:hypothetical protein
MKNLIASSQYFLIDFFEFSDSARKKMSAAESLFQYRKTCISGFMSLDCALSVFWKEVVVPDWVNLMGICNELLSSDSELDSFVEKMGSSLTRGQMVASLRFLENTGEPERFSPSLVDCGIVLCLLQDRSEKLPFLEAAQKLCRMQKFRNCVFHTGKNFSEIEAAASMKGLKDLFHLLPKINPVFRDAFEEPAQAAKKAA